MTDLSTAEMRELLLRFSLEAVVVAGCLLWAYCRCGWRQSFVGLGGRRAKLALAFVATLTVVQLVDRWQYHFPPRLSFYPLARFAMYQTGTIPEDGIRTYRLLAETADDPREINVTKRFGAVGLPSLNTRFRIIGERLLGGDAGDRQWAERQLQLYGDSLVRQTLARGAPSPTAIHFEVWRYPLGTSAPKEGELIERVQCFSELRQP